MQFLNKEIQSPVAWSTTQYHFGFSSDLSGAAIWKTTQEEAAKENSTTRVEDAEENPKETADVEQAFNNLSTIGGIRWKRGLVVVGFGVDGVIIMDELVGGAWCNAMDNYGTRNSMKRGFWSKVFANFEKEMVEPFENTIPSSSNGNIRFVLKLLHLVLFTIVSKGWTRAVNGSPTPEFSLERGLHQGDRLSSFLLILIMEGFHLSVEEDMCFKRIKGVTIGNPSINLSHFFFADDVIILSDWDTHDLQQITSTLNSFYCASGLKINISKSNLFGIGVTEEDLHTMASVTGCQASSFPTTYLGLPIAPEFIINTLEKNRPRFFWGGSEGNKKMAWVRWENVLAYLDQGGLGIGSLKVFNIALLQKWRWRFTTNSDLLWVKLIKAIHGIEAGFDGKGCATTRVWSSIIGSTNYLHSHNLIPKDTLKCHPGNGTSIRFWKDLWFGEELLCTRYNRLFRLDVNEDCFLSERFNEGGWNWQWLRPIIFGRNDVSFSVASTRTHIDHYMLPSLTSTTTWIACLPRKLNIFLWRFNLDRLSHRLNLSKHGIEIGFILCPTCNNNMESAEHIFFSCKMAAQIWHMIRVWCNIDLATPSYSDWRQ
nr:RNA-directed DNA polymerase, eukaryota, reverse transcriptase zinc-binding domain protein [Tanacetum cinerariifolium]